MMLGGSCLLIELYALAGTNTGVMAKWQEIDKARILDNPLTGQLAPAWMRSFLDFSSPLLNNMSIFILCIELTVMAL